MLIKSWGKFIFIGLALGLTLPAYADDEPDGMYKGRRIISKTLADFCQIKGDDIVNDRQAIKNCMEKLAAKIAASDQRTREEGQKEYQKILLDQSVYTVAAAKTRSANAQNYEDEYYNLLQASSSSGVDIHNSEAAIAANIEKQLTPLTELISMQSENLKSKTLHSAAQMDGSLPPVLPADGNAENINYSGMYEDLQVVPNGLAIYCRMNGEDFAEADTPEKTEKVQKCLNLIITNINSSGAAREDNRKTYQAILNEASLNLFYQAMAQNAGDVDYAKARNEQDKANGETITEYESTYSTASAANLKLNVMNEFLKSFAIGSIYDAIRGLDLVDASAVANRLKTDGVATEAKDSAVDISSQSVSVTVEAGAQVETTDDDEDTDEDYDEDYDEDDYDDADIEAMLDNTSEMAGTIKNEDTAGDKTAKTAEYRKLKAKYEQELADWTAKGEVLAQKEKELMAQYGTMDATEYARRKKEITDEFAILEQEANKSQQKLKQLQEQMAQDGVRWDDL